MSGSLELVIGPMFASKTTELIRIANRYSVIGKKVLAINHIINNRYDTNFICSHDNRQLQSITMEFLMNVFELADFKTADLIIIEELQFFSDAFEFITKAVDTHCKTVVAAGLSGDYKREEFGHVLKLIPHADKITKLSALCLQCSDGTEAHFTRKNINNTDQIRVGASDIYEPVCRKHYLM